jgi:hypothetical protein
LRGEVPDSLQPPPHFVPTAVVLVSHASGGLLADEVARVGVHGEPAIRAYAADMIGADGRTKLTDSGCARKAGGPIIGGTLTLTCGR